MKFDDPAANKLLTMDQPHRRVGLTEPAVFGRKVWRNE